MNGTGSSAFYASLLRNESPSVIVRVRREREDLYLCLFPLVAFLSVWCGSSIALLRPPLPLSPCQPFFPCLSPSLPPPRRCWSGGMGDGGRMEDRREGEEEKGGGGGILQVATASQSMVHRGTWLLHPFTALHLIHRGERQRTAGCGSNVYKAPSSPSYCCYACQASSSALACMKPELITVANSPAEISSSF